MKLLILFLQFFVTSFALASCAPMNLITQPNSPFRKIPVYNQESFNICYAYSAAQMADYKLIEAGASKASVHPAWVALSYALKKGRDSLEIGHPSEALNVLRTEFNCDSQNLRLSSETLRNLSPSDLRDLMLRDCVPQTLTLPVSERHNFTTLPDDETFANFMDISLEQSRAPVSLAYCSNVWGANSYDGIGLTSAGVRDDLAKDCRYHESLLVGKRPRGNQCEFLVRNSWGDEWISEIKDRTCVCRDRKTGAYHEDCREETHGSREFSIEACWIGRGSLSRNTGAITVFSDRPTNYGSLRTGF